MPGACCSRETEAEQRAGQQSCGTVSGCMFGNLTLELSKQTETILARLQEIFDAKAAMIEPTIAEALRARPSAPDIRPFRAPWPVFSLVTGAVP
jgi:TetR/AcrR family transcriptional regulator, transcriptional repressor for nem operon